MFVDWANNTSPVLGQAIESDPIVVIPVGSTEQHGAHLPLGCDAFAAENVAKRAVDGWTGNRPVFLLPTVWTGLSPHHMGLPGSITLRADTFVALLEDICTSLLKQGVRRLLLLNGHGGNIAAMDVALTRLGERGLETERVVALTYWHLVAGRTSEFRDSKSGGTGHAGEFETSIMLVTHPKYVDSGAAVTSYPQLPSSYLSTDLFGSAPARRYMPFHRMSESGTLGDPSLGSKEKGERILEACTEELLAFLVDFESW